MAFDTDSGVRYMSSRSVHHNECHIQIHFDYTQYKSCQSSHGESQVRGPEQVEKRLLRSILAAYNSVRVDTILQDDYVHGERSRKWRNIRIT